MDYKPKQFCDAFIETLDFHDSCRAAKVNKNLMAVQLSDSESDVSIYIKDKIDIYAMANSFITTDYIKYKLGQIILTGDHSYVIAAAKLLLGFDENDDKTGEFTKLIEAVKQNKEIEHDT